MRKEPVYIKKSGLKSCPFCSSRRVWEVLDQQTITGRAEEMNYHCRRCDVIFLCVGEKRSTGEPQ